MNLSQLPVIESCNDCGACCSVQGAPPDYVALQLNPHFADDPSFADDVIRLRNLPREPAARLQTYLQEVEAGVRHKDSPCIWLAECGTRCKYYDWRPSTCRVFEINSPGCHYYRQLQTRRRDVLSVACDYPADALLTDSASKHVVRSADGHSDA